MKSDAYLQSYEVSLELAVQAFKSGRATLLTKDGQPVYAPEEHQRREEALRQPLEAEIVSAKEAAQEEQAEAKAALATLEGYDPLDSLTEAELGRAASLAPFVREDVAELAPERLEARVSAVLASKDRVAIRLWTRYVGRRYDASLSAGRTDGLAALHEPLRRLRATDTAAKQQREQLEARVAAAQKLDGHALRAGWELQGGLEQMMRRGYVTRA
jgi:hypothetical protein